MNVKGLKTLLNDFNDEDEVKYWVEVNGEVIARPNMSPIEKDELFNWEDEFDAIKFDKKNTWNSIVELHDFTETILMELENKLQLNPEFVKELKNIDRTEFTEVKLEDPTFWDLVEDVKFATTIDEVITYYKPLIWFVQEKIPNTEVWIESNKLFIKQIDNKSLSSAIIAELLKISVKYIDGKEQFRGVWSITLE